LLKACSKISLSSLFEISTFAKSNSSHCFHNSSIILSKVSCEIFPASNNLSIIGKYLFSFTSHGISLHLSLRGILVPFGSSTTFTFGEVLFFTRVEPEVVTILSCVPSILDISVVPICSAGAITTFCVSVFHTVIVP
jgi:hypothetical protein